MMTSFIFHIGNVRFVEKGDIHIYIPIPPVSETLHRSPASVPRVAMCA